MIFSFGGTLSSAHPWLVLPREKFTEARHGCRAISFVAYLFRQANCAATCCYLRAVTVRPSLWNETTVSIRFWNSRYDCAIRSLNREWNKIEKGFSHRYEILGTRRGYPKGKLIETAGCFGCRVFPSQSHLDRVYRSIRWKWNLARAEISYLGDPADK